MLGQNFLNAEYAKKLLDLIPSNREVLEIGPGKGAITYGLSEISKSVIAVEIDSKLASGITEKSNLRVIRADFLKFDLQKFSNITLVGNIPYYITRSILLKLVMNYSKFRDVFLMLPAPMLSKNTRLTALLQFRFSIEYLLKVPRTSFSPVPKIDSYFVKLVPILNYYPRVSLESFRNTLRKLFLHPRKKLKNLNFTPYLEGLRSDVLTTHQIALISCI